MAGRRRGAEANRTEKDRKLGHTIRTKTVEH